MTGKQKDCLFARRKLRLCWLAALTLAGPLEAGAGQMSVEGIMAGDAIALFHGWKVSVKGGHEAADSHAGPGQRGIARQKVALRVLLESKDATRWENYRRSSRLFARGMFVEAQIGFGATSIYIPNPEGNVGQRYGLSGYHCHNRSYYCPVGDYRNSSAAPGFGLATGYNFRHWAGLRLGIRHMDNEYSAVNLGPAFYFGRTHRYILKLGLSYYVDLSSDYTPYHPEKLGAALTNAYGYFLDSGLWLEAGIDSIYSSLNSHSFAFRVGYRF